MSSIKPELSAHTIANQIRMEAAIHKGCFLLVEGDSDYRLFKNFSAAPELCSVVPCSGKSTLIESINILSKDKLDRVLGVADRDYGDIVGFPEVSGNIVYTDENDMEIMILHSDALQNLLNEYGSRGKCDAECRIHQKSILELLLESASEIGAIRLAARKYGWALKFEDQTYKFVDNNSYEVDRSRSISHVWARSQDVQGVGIDDIARACAEVVADVDSPVALCNGHDCVRVLGKALRSKIGSTNQFNSEDRVADLEKVLRLTYEFAYFQQTKMHGTIRQWEIDTGHRVLKNV